MEINKDKYKLDSNNYHKKKSDKTQIVLSFSLRKDDYHIKRLQKKEFGQTKEWNTFTISRNGDIYQHFDPKYYSNYIGDKFGNKLAITITLENMGSLVKLDNGTFINFLNEECDEENVVEKNWIGFNYWEKITNEQFNSVVELCNMLCDDFDIPKTCIEFNHYHKDIKNFNGIAFKGNYIIDCSDLNPTFNINKFSSKLK
ncbi:MAG: N-acetylmuramoyl-L-alanine amidase [bacterium]